MSLDGLGCALLFLPASNPRAIAKAREAGSDLVVLDLEDAVKPEDKDAARDAAVEAVETAWPMPVAIRINGVGSEWHSLDLDAAARSAADLVVVPRAISAAASTPATAGLIAGTNDLAADLRLPPSAGRAPLQTALQTIVLAARAAGVAVFDGVFNELENAPGLVAEAEEGRRLGFDGKSLIHPSQIEPCRRAFAPTEAEIEHARRLVAAFDGGAERFEDQMIERMHVEAARRLLGRVTP